MDLLNDKKTTTKEFLKKVKVVTKPNWRLIRETANNAEKNIATYEHLI